MKTNNLYNISTLIYKMIVYNLRIIFANKFIWFLAGSILFYIGLSVIYVFDQDVSNMRDLYGVFLFSGLLLVFYPSAFGIQNDQDSRTIEILFGIPNYRYKVWLVRIILIFVIAFLIMLVFTFLASVLIVKFRFVNVTAQVMMPVLFLGLMAFMLSTVVRNGNGTAVIMIIFGLFFLILADSLNKSQWNIFLNPYDLPYDVNETTWAIITFKNRIILITGSIIFLLAALYNLQNREKFM
jgi:ABC-type transport system involved in multi-copper enzyme maturation permease subunit